MRSLPAPLIMSGSSSFSLLRLVVGREDTGPIFSRDGNRERCKNQTREDGFHNRLIALVFNPSMIRPAIIFYTLFFGAVALRAQDTLFPTSVPTPTPSETTAASPAAT